jgi:hypothetical protein
MREHPRPTVVGFGQRARQEEVDPRCRRHAVWTKETRQRGVHTVGPCLTDGLPLRVQPEWRTRLKHSRQS